MSKEKNSLKLVEPHVDAETRVHDDHHLSVRLWLRMLSCTNRIENVVRQNPQANFDTTLPRFDLMAQLERAPQGLKMSELSQRMMVTGGNVTGITDGLEKEGLVVREVDASDRRVYRVRLTPEGQKQFRRMATEHEQWIITLFDGMSARNKNQLTELLGDLKRHISQSGPFEHLHDDGHLDGYQPQHFLWAQHGRVGVITLNRPERKNSLTFESYAELRDLFRRLPQVSDVRAIVLTGAGGNFCSGGDVHEIIGPLTQMDFAGLLNFTRMTGDLVKAMRHCPQPIVAAVDGVCAGAGAILAMASDLRLATARAKTAFLFTRVGLAGCDMGACALLPRIIGHGRASELLFTGRSMSAAEGAAWGFFNRVEEPDSVLQQAMQLATDLATGPTYAHAMTKKMLHAEWDMPIDAAIDAEAQAQAVCMQTEDFGRAYRAFAAKQKPQFEGN